MAIESYRDLDVWNRGRAVVKMVYRATGGFPKEERFGLTSQARRAAASIPANIAEGWGRHYPAEFIQYLRRANGSRTELETHLIVATDLGFLTPEQIAPILKETEILGRQLLSLERAISRRKKT